MIRNLKKMRGDRPASNYKRQQPRGGMNQGYGGMRNTGGVRNMGRGYQLDEDDFMDDDDFGDFDVHGAGAQGYEFDEDDDDDEFDFEGYGGGGYPGGMYGMDPNMPDDQYAALMAEDDDDIDIGDSYLNENYLGGQNLGASNPYAQQIQNMDAMRRAAGNTAGAFDNEFDEFDDDDDDDDLFGDAKKPVNMEVGLGSDDDGFGDDDDDDDFDFDFDIGAMAKNTKKQMEAEKEKEEADERRKMEEKERKKEEERQKEIREKEDRMRELEDLRKKKEKEEQENRDRERREEEMRLKAQIEKSLSKKSKGFSRNLEGSEFGNLLEGMERSGARNQSKEGSIGGFSDLFPNDTQENHEREPSIPKTLSGMSGINKRTEGTHNDLNANIHPNENKGKTSFDHWQDRNFEGEDTEEIKGGDLLEDEDPNSELFDPNYEGGDKLVPDNAMRNLKHSNFSFQPKESSTALKLPPHGKEQKDRKRHREIEGAARAIIYEEQRKAENYLNKLSNQENDFKDKKELYDKTQLRNARLDTQITNLLQDKQDIDKENLELKKRLEEFRENTEALQERIDIKEARIEELLLVNRGLEQECAQKNRLLKERENFQRKLYINDALEQQRRNFETQIEAMKFKNEMLKERVDKAEETIETYRLAGAMDHDEQVPNAGDNKAAEILQKDYEAKISLMQAKLDKRDLMHKRESNEDEFEKELLVGELLIKGLTKENERLIDENRKIKGRVQELEGNLNDEHRKLLQTKTRLSYTVGFNEERELKETITRLQEELMKKDEFYREKMERYNEMEKKAGEFDELEERFKQNTQIAMKLKEDKDEKENYFKEMLQTQNSHFGQQMISLEEERNKINMERQDARRMSKQLKKELKSVKESFERFKKEKEEEIAKLKKAKKRIPKKPNSIVRKSHKSRNSKTPSEKSRKPDKRIKRKKNPREKITSMKEPFLDTEDIGDILIKPILSDSFTNTNNKPRDTMFGKSESSFFRKSVVMEDKDQSYESRKKLVKSIIQKLKKGDIIQGINDLLDNIVIQFSQGQEDQIIYPLDDLKQICEGQLGNIYNCEKFLKKVQETVRAFQQVQESDDMGEFRAELVKQTEKIFVDDMFVFLPEYLKGKLMRESSVTKNNFIMRPQKNDGPSKLFVERLKRDNKNLKEELTHLRTEREKLEKIIRDNPKTVRDIDFAILERKIDLIEKNSKMQALNVHSNLNNALKTIGNATKESEPSSWKLEKSKLINLVKRKNREISLFRHELDKLLLQLVELKKSKKS